MDHGADHQKVEEIFLAALERDPAERGAFLDGACFGDPAARALVEELLSHADEEEFLREPKLETGLDLAAILEEELARHAAAEGEQAPELGEVEELDPELAKLVADGLERKGSRFFSQSPDTLF